MTFRSHAIRTPSSLATSNEQTFALRRGRAQWLVIALWVIVLLALPRFMSTYWVHLAVNCLIAIIGAVALNILTGNARLVSLGQAASSASAPSPPVCSSAPTAFRSLSLWRLRR